VVRSTPERLCRHRPGTSPGFPGTARSPRTSSTCGGNRAASGLRVNAHACSR
jgi:hypothetical protein